MADASETIPFRNAADLDQNSYESMCNIDVEDGSENDFCSSYGTISFLGIMRKSLAEFVHLKKDKIEIEENGSFNEEKLKAIFKLMTDQWEIHSPNLIVSVTGGAKNFDIDDDVLTVFKDIIRKISQTPGAWVVTGGTHAGVMKHVGDALREQSNAICLGIPTFGVIDERESLLGQQESELEGQKKLKRMQSYHVGSWLKAKGCYLDPNHTHFLLYDDGTVEEFGGEIRFRAEFEDYVAKEMTIPYILIVLNGGPGTFKTIYETITRGHKVILLKGSGGVADFVANFVEKVRYGNNYIAQPEQLRSRLKDKFKDNYDHYMEIFDHRKNLFVLAEKEGKGNINDVVIDALLSPDNDSSVKIETSEYLRLALLWQNPQVLMKTIPINKPENVVSDPINLAEDSGGKGGKKVWFGDIEKLLIMALARGDVQFVKLLLLDYEVDLNGLLTKEVLQLLYGYQSYEKNFKILDYDMKYTDYEGIDSLDECGVKFAEYIYHYNQNKEYNEGKDCLLKVKTIDKLRRKCYKGFGPFSTLDSGSRNILCDPLWELFLWSVVCNLPEMAKALWSLESDQIAKALIASNYWQQLSTEDTHTEQEIESFRENGATFNSLACSLLDECYKRSEEKAINIITKTLDHVPDESCLSLAVEFYNIKFVAHTCVQKVLNDVWTGEIEQNEMTTTTSYLWILFGMFFPCFVGKLFRFHPPDSITSENDNRRSSCVSNCCPYVKRFYGAPVVSFLLHLIFNVAFVVLYSYLLIAEGIHVNFSLADYLLYVMGLGHLTTELYQICQYEEKAMTGKVRSWIADVYSINFWDAVILGLFLIAFILNLFAITASVSHTLHSINCALWILRMTTALRVHPVYGQYYEMVKLMLSDLSSFLLGLVFLTLAYGVFSTSVLYPNGTSELPERSFLFLVMRPWFHIYGEFFVELRQGNGTETSFDTDRNKGYDEYIVWIVLGIYLCFTNIIILNIIIAVFNNTYNEVMLKGMALWKFNRYHFIVEYVKRLPWPPPFCIIPHFVLFMRWIMMQILKCCRKKRSTRGATWITNIALKKNLLNYDLKRDSSTFTEADKIRLSQYESDRALFLFKNHIEFVDGEVVIRGLDSMMQSSSTGAVSDEQWEIIQMTSKFEDAVKAGNRTIKELSELMEKIEQLRPQQEGKQSDDPSI